MLKTPPVYGYPPEEGRYVRGNDYSPVALCVILDTFDYAIPSDLNVLVMAGADIGAALSGMLQTENTGLEKIICNIVANPNIRYIVLCGRESSGHLCGEALKALKYNGIDDEKRIIGSNALTPYVYNIPTEIVERFRSQIVDIIDLLCKPGETNIEKSGLNPETVSEAIQACYQEEPTKFQNYSVHDIGAYPKPPIYHKIAAKLEQPQQAVEPGKSMMGMGLVFHKLLPKTDCKECGKQNCLAFAIDLAKGKLELDDCPVINREEFEADRRALMKLL